VAAGVDGSMTTADVWDVQIALQVSKRLGSPLLRLYQLFWEHVLVCRSQEDKVVVLVGRVKQGRLEVSSVGSHKW
jgi:hypothetical protein